MATVGRRASTELRPVAVRPDGVAADVLVEAAADVPAQAVLEAIAAEIDVDGSSDRGRRRRATRHSGRRA
jgi:hypothetical protein